jgi:hypothetical protein
VKVERASVAPPVPRENRVGMKRDVILQSFPASAKRSSNTCRMVMTVGPISTGPAAESRVRILPPGPLAMSTTTTDRPRAASLSAADNPPIPAPMMTTWRFWGSRGLARDKSL